MANVELEWDARSIVRELLGIGATRQIEEQWTLAPVVNPDKLRAIRSAFQLVVDGEATDPESDKLLTAYLGENYMDWIQQGWYCLGRKCDVDRVGFRFDFHDDRFFFVAIRNAFRG